VPGGRFLQKDDVGCDFRTCVFLESRIGKADSADQVRPVGEILPDRVVLLVHRVTARDERDNPARSHLVDGLRKEVIVDGLRLRGFIGRIMDAVITKRDIAERNVKIVVGEVRVLVSLVEDGGIRIELLRDTRGDVVSSTPVRLPSSGIRPKKCPTPIAGSRTVTPSSTPMCFMPSHMAEITIGDVKCALGMAPQPAYLASTVFSSSVASRFSC
jgi:hypothetical protein